jgi:hypothetical protein
VFATEKGARLRRYTPKRFALGAARTRGLKAIEADLATEFLKQHKAVRIAAPRLFGVDFDLVAYSSAERILWFCEMTTSGFPGKGGGDSASGWPEVLRIICEVFDSEGS